jgi:hypothetical protein
MKKFVIFGAGDIGKTVLEALGEEYVLCFADSRKGGQIYLGKEVLSPERLLPLRNEVQLIVASFDYAEEICRSLRAYGIEEYLVWTKEMNQCLAECSPRYYIRNEWLPYPLSRAFFSHAYTAYNAIVVYCYADLQGLCRAFTEAVGISYKVRRFMLYGEDAENAFTAIRNDIDCLIMAVRREDNEICAEAEECANEGRFAIIDLHDVVPHIPELHCPEIRRYKDKYKDRRCFLIGNGPSLRAEDLDTLHRHGEITFACNKIYLMFDRTQWRPDFYCVSDTAGLAWYWEKIIQLINGPVKIFSSYLRYILPNMRFDAHTVFVYMTHENCENSLPRFSSDASVQCFVGYTILYDIMLQVAAYMGFDEIYLLGVDNTLPVSDKFGTYSHFSADYFTKEEIVYYDHIGKRSYPGRVNAAYESAKQYACRHGFKIFNATRGGMLKIFERVDFDSLFR